MGLGLSFGLILGAALGFSGLARAEGGSPGNEIMVLGQAPGTGTSPAGQNTDRTGKVEGRQHTGTDTDALAENQRERAELRRELRELRRELNEQRKEAQQKAARALRAERAANERRAEVRRERL